MPVPESEQEGGSRAEASAEDVRVDVDPATSSPEQSGPENAPNQNGVSDPGRTQGPYFTSEDPSPASSVSMGAGRKSLRKRVSRDETFKRRMNQQQRRELLYELRADGGYEMKEMSVREVFQYVQACVEPYALTYLSPRSSGGGGGGDDGQLSRRKSMVNLEARKRRSTSMSGMQYMGSNGLHQRDLRQLFDARATSEPSFAVRRNVVLMNFETLRGIILVDRVILVVDVGADSILMDVQRSIVELPEDVYEFELKAVEALLSVSSRRLEKEVKEIEPEVQGIVKVMEGPGNAATSAENNDRFRHLATRVHELETRAKARRRAILQVLEEDMDLCMMNLTKMSEDPALYEPPISREVLEDHEEMELLLEAFLQGINSLSNVLEVMSIRMRNTEALVMVKLDIARNRLLTADLMFSMGSMCFTMGALVAGLFGMNLHSGLESSGEWFWWVTVVTLASVSLAGLMVLMYFKQSGILVS